MEFYLDTVFDGNAGESIEFGDPVFDVATVRRVGTRKRRRRARRWRRRSRRRDPKDLRRRRSRRTPLTAIFRSVTIIIAEFSIAIFWSPITTTRNPSLSIHKHNLWRKKNLNYSKLDLIEISTWSYQKIEWWRREIQKKKKKKMEKKRNTRNDEEALRD